MRKWIATATVALAASAAHAQLTHHYTWDVDGTDASGNGNNGTFTGNAAVGVGPVGVGGLSLQQGTTGSGYQGAFRLPTATSTPTPDMTFSMWINVARIPPGPGATGGPESFVIGYVTDGINNPNLQLRINGGSGVFQLGQWDGFTYSANNTGSLGGNLIGTGWRHVAAVISSTAPERLFVDGSLCRVFDMSNTLPGNLVSAYVGALENGTGNFIGPFESGIDDLRMYNTALSDAEIAELALPPQNITWAVNASGTWSDAANWTNGSVPNGARANAILGNAIDADRTITLNGPVALSSLALKKTSGNGAYTVNLGGSANLAADSLAIANGTLTLADAQGSAVKTKSVAIGYTATLRLDGATLAVDYGAASPLATLVAKFLEGRLTSTDQTIGIVEAAALGLTSFGGVSVDGTTLLLRGTLRGDATLDGTVNFDDLLKLAQGYGATTGAGWAQGDTDYNGAVNFDDLLALAQNYGQSATLAGDMLKDLGYASFAGDWARAVALVPEPASLGLVALLGVARRKRRHA